MYFVDTEAATLPMPDIPTSQSHHKYATCQAVSMEELCVKNSTATDKLMNNQHLNTKSKQLMASQLARDDCNDSTAMLELDLASTSASESLNYIETDTVKYSVVKS